MADDEEVYVRRSVKDLAAGLNAGEVGRVPITSSPAKPLPKVKPKFIRSATTEVPSGPTTDTGVGNQPAGQETNGKPGPTLPARQSTDKKPPEKVIPILPARRNAEPVAEKPPVPGIPPRRAGNQPVLPARNPSQPITPSSPPSLPSRSKVAGAPSLPDRRASKVPSTPSQPTTNGSRMKAPVYDPSTLPPLPPKRNKHADEADEEAAPSLPPRRSLAAEAEEEDEEEPPPLPTRTPRLPKLPSRPESTPPEQPPRRLPPRNIPSVAQRPPRTPSANGSTSSATPPPVPSSTRPDLSRLLSTKPKYDPSASTNGTDAATASTSCLRCWDFSGPDNHAAKFPRQTVSSLDQLARDLTQPFHSPTDKARAIFTWLHHNIAYDCDAFFNNGCRSVSPQDTFNKGAAVCSGYADLFVDLCVKSGLEAIVISGHGKGFGHKDLEPGEAVPPVKGGHAWNAVKIDIGGPNGNGQMYWKLVDSCWGAGSVGNDKQFHKGFKPNHFVDSNEDFGLRHFPHDNTKFFRADGRVIPWAEYYVGDTGGAPPQVYSDIDAGILPVHFVPLQKRISADPAAHALSNGIVRFQFQRVCQHWKPEVHGKGKKDYVYAIATKEGKWVPFQHNGFYWWCDVPVERLGPPGENVNLWCIQTVNGQDARGMTPQEYVDKQGRAGMSFGAVAQWIMV